MSLDTQTNRKSIQNVLFITYERTNEPQQLLSPHALLLDFDVAFGNSIHQRRILRSRGSVGSDRHGKDGIPTASLDSNRKTSGKLAR